MEQTTGLTGVGEYLTLLLELDASFLNEDIHAASAESVPGLSRRILMCGRKLPEPCMADN